MKATTRSSKHGESKRRIFQPGTNRLPRFLIPAGERKDATRHAACLERQRATLSSRCTSKVRGRRQPHVHEFYVYVLEPRWSTCQCCSTRHIGRTPTRFIPTIPYDSLDRANMTRCTESLPEHRARDRAELVLAENDLRYCRVQK